MKIKIICDGKSTKVVDADSGELVEGVQMVSFVASTGDAPEAFFHVQPIQCDIVTDAAADVFQSRNPFNVEDFESQWFGLLDKEPK